MADIIDCMDSFYRRRKNDAKEKLSMLFLLAESTAEHIGCYLNTANKARQPWEVFPNLFAEEKELHEKQMARQQMDTARENRKKYAAELKRRRKSCLM